jgi:hypothetical protein
MPKSPWLRRAIPAVALLSTVPARADIPPTRGVVESPIGLVVVAAAIAAIGVFLFRRLRRK